jgi:hypothetical protein
MMIGGLRVQNSEIPPTHQSKLSIHATAIAAWVRPQAPKQSRENAIFSDRPRLGCDLCCATTGSSRRNKPTPFAI